MATAERHPLDHGWVTPEGYICDGCTVRDGYEHRCHGADAGPLCECPDCTIECDRCGTLAPFPNAKTPAGWFICSPHPSDGIGEALCPACASNDCDNPEDDRWWEEDEELTT